MRKAEFCVTCLAQYKSEMYIPDEVEDGKELSYIREHLDECPVQELDWVGDLSPEEAVTEEDVAILSGHGDKNPSVMTSLITHIIRTCNSYYPEASLKIYKFMADVTDSMEPQIDIGIDEDEGTIIIRLPESKSDYEKIRDFAKSLAFFAVMAAHSDNKDLTMIEKTGNLPKLYQDEADSLFNTIFQKDQWLQEELKLEALYGRDGTEG